MSANLSNSAQRQRLLAALHEHGQIATTDCRDYLSIMSPAARVMELRRAGHEIKTVWRRVSDAAGIVHRQGVYVLGVDHAS